MAVYEIFYAFRPYIDVLSIINKIAITCVVNGTEDCYLLIEGYWFSVKNPSAPPVMDPYLSRVAAVSFKGLYIHTIAGY